MPLELLNRLSSLKVLTFITAQIEVVTRKLNFSSNCQVTWTHYGGSVPEFSELEPWASIRKMAFLEAIFVHLIDAHGRIDGKY